MAAAIPVKGEAVPVVGVVVGQASGDWNSGFCSCANCPSLPCLVTWFTPSVTMGHLFEKVYRVRYSCLFITILFITAQIYMYEETQKIVPLMEMGKVNFTIDNEIIAIEIPVATDESIAQSNWVSTLSFWIFLSMCMLTCQLRGTIRKKYGIAGNACSDCFASCCCECCSLTQMLKQEEVTKDYNICSSTGTTLV